MASHAGIGHIGGLVGLNQGSQIINSTSSSSVTSSQLSNAGGLVGTNFGQIARQLQQRSHIKIGQRYCRRPGGRK